MEEENEPVPIELHRPELELAWRGLLWSIKAGYLTREDAIGKLKEWDGESLTISHTDIIEVDE